MANSFPASPPTETELLAIDESICLWLAKNHEGNPESAAVLFVSDNRIGIVQHRRTDQENREHYLIMPLAELSQGWGADEIAKWAYSEDLRAINLFEATEFIDSQV